MNFPRLNFPEYNFRIRSSGQNSQIFDRIRKKFVVLTPEEWVRQHLLHFLTEEKKFPESLLAVEKEIHYQDMQRRPDIVLYGKNLQPLLIAECKAPDVRITQETFDQAARYNLVLNVNYFILTNGITHFSCIPDKENSRYQYLDEIPDYHSICT